MPEKVKVSLEVANAYLELLDKHDGNSLAVVYEWSEKLLPHKTDSVWKDVDWFTLLALITGNYEVLPEKIAKTEVEHLREMLRDTRKIVRQKVNEVKTLQNACKKHKEKQEALEFQLKVSIMHAEELDEELEAAVAEIEKLQELLEGNDGMSVKDIRYQFVDLHRHFLNVQMENEQLREALKFYANNANYLIEWSDKCDEYMPSVADNDGGEIARQALGIT